MPGVEDAVPHRGDSTGSNREGQHDQRTPLYRGHNGVSIKILTERLRICCR
jgi:hypothetical protein